MRMAGVIGRRKIDREAVVVKIRLWDILVRHDVNILIGAGDMVSVVA